MDEIVVTRLWMAGVVAAMAVFGVIALVGYYRQSNDSNEDDDWSEIVVEDLPNLEPLFVLNL